MIIRGEKNKITCPKPERSRPIICAKRPSSRKRSDNLIFMNRINRVSMKYSRKIKSENCLTDIIDYRRRTECVRKRQPELFVIASIVRYLFICDGVESMKPQAFQELSNTAVVGTGSKGGEASRGPCLGRQS